MNNNLRKIPEEFIPTKKDLYKRIKQLEDVIKEITKYAKIIKSGVDKKSAVYLESEQIDRMAQKVLKGKD